MLTDEMRYTLMRLLERFGGFGHACIGKSRQVNERRQIQSTSGFGDKLADGDGIEMEIA